MSLGKCVGEFSLQSTSVGFKKQSIDSQNLSINLEGTVSGGDETRIVLGTLELNQTLGHSEGTYNWLGSEFPIEGDVRSNSGGGFYLYTGSNHWQLRGTISYFNGSSVALEADFDLASRSLTGKLFEWSIRYVD